MTSAQPANSGKGTRLQLQRMERALVRARLQLPGMMRKPDYQALRYALGLTRIRQIRVDGADVVIDPAVVAPLREWVLSRLAAYLRPDTDPATSLEACIQAMPRVRELMLQARQQLLDTHRDDLDADALDREAGTRALVNVAGGGGGAGYVYIGAYARLMEDDLIPDYIVGNSIGSVLGLFRAYRRRLDLEENLQLLRSLTYPDILTPARRRADLCLPGLLQLHLKVLHRWFVTGKHRRPLRLNEMEIPLDLMVAGIRRRPFEALPQEKQDPAAGMSRWMPLPVQLARRFMRLTDFVSPTLVKPLVLGGEGDTGLLHAVDVVGFSASVPTVLQYELRGRAGRTRELYAELMHRHDLSALIDGGVADNVPARAAWHSVHAGRIGQRNAYYLAFDCLFPKWDAKNVWLWPVTQAVQRQMRANRVYADTMMRFDPTLSPLNLVPAGDSVDKALAWGWAQMDRAMPEVRAMMEPVAHAWAAT